MNEPILQEIFIRTAYIVQYILATGSLAFFIETSFHCQKSVAQHRGHVKPRISIPKTLAKTKIFENITALIVGVTQSGSCGPIHGKSTRPREFGKPTRVTAQQKRTQKNNSTFFLLFLFYYMNMRRLWFLSHHRASETKKKKTI